MDGFRPDVEGLRALAIGIVLLAHAGVGFAAGGYVGVDVFFVISGFLITRLLVGELERTGRVSLPHFYARRVRRLMPQAITAVVVVAVVSRQLLAPLEADAVMRDVVAAGFYVMNWHLAAESVDYFASGAHDGPLDHFWSLAVEEQYYVVWPLLLLALAGRRRHVRRTLAVGLAAILVASLLYAVHRIGVAPEQTYFSTVARAWELALGGLLAVVLMGRRLGPRTAAAAAWGGMAAIAVATAGFDAGTAVPALPALLPALGAAALVAAGTAEALPVPSRVLTLRPARFVGRVSYAWYVWHWPVLVFAAALRGPLSTAEGLAATAVAFVPTIVTHRWIEEPIRRSRMRMARFALVTVPAAAALVLAAAIGLSWTLPSPPTLAAGKAAGAARLGDLQRAATALRPTPRDAEADRGRAFADGCLVGATETTSPACVYGDLDSSTTVVLFGDSHAMQWFPALEWVVARRGWRLVELTKAGCPPQAVDVLWAPGRREYPECDAWREYALDRIANVEKPALVIVASSVQYRVLDDGRTLSREESMRALADGYPAPLDRLRHAVPRVAVIQDVPLPPRDIPSCVAEALDDLLRCAFPRRQAVTRAAAIAAPAARPAVDVIDPTSRFCVGERCPAVVGDVLVYRNTGHVTATYMHTLGPWLERRLPTLTEGER